MRHSHVEESNAPRVLHVQPRRATPQEEEAAYQVKFREPNFLPKQHEEQAVTVVLRQTPVRG
jgi:hypothetical protein